jgi:hypothetical protein
LIIGDIDTGYRIEARRLAVYIYLGAQPLLDFYGFLRRDVPAVQSW